jgi:GDP-L-fucose synthase
MKVLITGASGMVGRNLAFSMAASHHTLLTPSSSELDLLNYENTFDFIVKNNPDLIIHAAGRVGGIQANIAEPVRFLTDNLDMGRNIVLATRNAGVKKLINLASSCMYPRNASNPLKEDMVLSGDLEPTNEGYALAKITTARLCQYVMSENPELHYKNTYSM